jgi:hypothetical protein
MKLVNKIQQADSGKLSDNSKIYTPTAEVIKKIADEYAIGFAYWCEWRNDRAFKTFEELLEIYKKEKDL